MSEAAQKLRFASFHEPPIMSGNFRITATQTYGSTKDGQAAIAMDLTGYELKLLKLASAADLPVGLPATVLVAEIDKALHFRVFDTEGSVLRDTPAAELGAWSAELDSLHKRLAKLWDTTVPPEDAAAFLKDIARYLGIRFSTERTFTVGGERYALNPQEVMAVFPPEGSAGDHSNVLPHVILKRKTLPWERLAVTHKPSDRAHPTPWMAILTFDDEQGDSAPELKTITLGTHGGADAADKLYQDPSVFYVHKDADVYEGGEAADWPVKVIDLPLDLALDMLPKFDELRYLAHVRQRENTLGNAIDAEHSVVIGTRVPTRGKQTVAYLVSLEHRYYDRSFWPSEGDKPVRLVVLKTWRFRCLDEAVFKITDKQIKALDDPKLAAFVTLHKAKLLGTEFIGEDAFKAALSGLEEAQIKALLLHAHVKEKSFKITDAVYDALSDQAARAFIDDHEDTLRNKEIRSERAFRGALDGLGAPHVEVLVEAALFKSVDKKLNFKSLLMQLKADALRLPASALPGPVDATAQSLIDQSLTLLPHALRNGTRSGAFYRGPLTGGGVISGHDLPITRAADHLLRQEASTGALDVSYAAAWQLGRMMMLSSKATAKALFDWKRAHAQWVKGAKQRLDHLPFSRLPGRLDLPELVRNWLYDTALLKGLPFAYLLPDPAMLPQESIRYFQVDPRWVEALLDGGFSIGRISTGDVARETKTAARDGTAFEQARNADLEALPTGAIEGAFIRSEVVAGWPHLQVDAVAFIGPQTAALAKTDLKTLEEDLSAVAFQQTQTLSKPCRDALIARGLTMPEPHLCAIRMTAESLAKKPETWLVLDISDGGARLICQIDARDRDHPNWTLDVKLPVLRVEHLAKGVLLCLFQGHIDALDVHLKPEAVHFGVGMPDIRHPEMYKELRHPDGRQDSDAIIESLPWRHRNGREIPQVLNVKTLATSKTSPKGMRHALGHPAPLRPAEFALQMVEGVDRVRFVRIGAEFADG